MKKKFGVLVVALAVASGFAGYFLQRSETGLSSLALANIEALTVGDETKMCSRASRTQNCYDSHNRWMCLRIAEVEYYTCTSLIEMCYHDQVTDCPPGAKYSR